MFDVLEYPIPLSLSFLSLDSQPYRDFFICIRFSLYKVWYEDLY